MLTFFKKNEIIYAVESMSSLTSDSAQQLNWLFGGTEMLPESALSGYFLGPRPSMVTPWSTNAVEITVNMGVYGISRIEMFQECTPEKSYDPMLKHLFHHLDQGIFDITIPVEPILFIDNIQEYNEKEGLALSVEEVAYLQDMSDRLGRLLTDSEIFGFSQVNSEHCRHKIFNGTFIINGEQQDLSLFQLIKKTAAKNQNFIVSAYKDNVAFIKGPEMVQWAPETSEIADFYKKTTTSSVLSLKAETHNFPTTVEPFNGAATGSGGEIRDRLAGGQGSLPLAGTAVYMTSYPRLEEGKYWEQHNPLRPWLYQNPLDILIKASNGASDFGNKFGQPLICGSVLTFEFFEENQNLAFDKVIMLAGGVGYTDAKQVEKKLPEKGDKIVLLGGDNYRIGMGGAAVSSADTGAFSSAIELNAIQRSNPEMQKRVANTIRAMVESGDNKIISIHDHGAGGHLNCFSELVESTGGKINIDQLPVGDPTLSFKEIIGNESQERMGLVIKEQDIPLLKEIAERERAPMYVVGEITGDHRFSFYSEKSNEKPIDLALSDFFGSSPKLILKDTKTNQQFDEVKTDTKDFISLFYEVLSLESVACKDWLTNKVDRCVGGRVAKQQNTGVFHLPLNNCGVMALDYDTNFGVATSVGHAPAVAIISPEEGSKMAITEALTNLVWAPLTHGLNGVSLSANWMWPCKNPGEDARLYAAVKACSEFAIELGINIPTGKDSLSMKQKYPDGREVLSPGTVIISSVAECNDISGVIEPNVQNSDDALYYIDWSKNKPSLGGSAFAQTQNKLGSQVPGVLSAQYVKDCFETIQEGIRQNLIVAGHDIGSGGLITTLCEMVFSSNISGLNITIPENVDLISFLFQENNGVVVQAKDSFIELLTNNRIDYIRLATPNHSGKVVIHDKEQKIDLDTTDLRKQWFKKSYLFDKHQTREDKATERFENFDKTPLQYTFPGDFTGKRPEPSQKRPVAAVLREKGSNSERELANALFLAGFDVKDIHTTDLMSGREDLRDIQFLGAVGGFSNSDVLGSAKGWAGALKYNERAKNVLADFFNREDTLSVGICNGCQLFVELNLIYPEHRTPPKMSFNDSRKHESGFVNVVVQKNNSVLMQNLEGSRLGVWISHGEGKFLLPLEQSQYQIVSKYSYSSYPANPNGSDFDTAMLCSQNGRHLVMMPHIERSVFPWNWPYYPKDRKDEVSPWVQAFVNGRNWLIDKRK
ncbi:MAG: phosphoribosylformylglycinamidine synthase [Saprospiraceae bacterium]|nr:phosphoribosylformylglycinamidine synthase [Saprospiraceae bacterium]